MFEKLRPWFRCGEHQIALTGPRAYKLAGWARVVPNDRGFLYSTTRTQLHTLVPFKWKLHDTPDRHLVSSSFSKGETAMKPTTGWDRIGNLKRSSTGTDQNLITSETKTNSSHHIYLNNVYYFEDMYFPPVHTSRVVRNYTVPQNRADCTLLLSSLQCGWLQ